MRVVTVYKSGGDFDVHYVIAMHNALKMYMPCPYEFVVLTDKPQEVNQFATSILLTHDLPKWWSKIELFNPDHFYNNDMDVTLYFDLDVLLLKNISALIRVCKSYTSPLMLLSSDKIGSKKDWPSSSIMSWKGSQMNAIYTKFFELGNVIEQSKSKISRAGQQTDQGFIRTIIDPSKFQHFLPNKYIVFKYPDYMENPKLIDTATILNWTGKPRFRSMGKLPDKYLTKLYAKIYSIWKERTNILINQE